MIFVGDIAVPNSIITGKLESFLKENEDIFRGKSMICNLEGLLSEHNYAKTNRPVLTNHTDLPSALKGIIKPIFCLANNHILDLPDEYDNTIRILRNENVPYCGAGKSRNDALKPLYFNEGQHQIILFNICWDFLLYNHKNPSSGVFVGELDETKLLNEVAKCKYTNPDSILIVYIHWSLDLEILPYPMYRMFSRDLIDAGAKIVAGSHSHCIQGGEKYKNGYIVYGLGNFFLPQNIYIRGGLIYPDFANIQMALEWDPVSDNAKCHWIEYKYDEGDHNLCYLGQDNFEESERLSQYSQFRLMSNNEYIEYFIKNRRKRLFIPVYTDYRRKLLNRTYTFFLKRRARTARLLAKLRIINWQN